MQQHLSYKPSGAPEVTSEGLNQNTFLGKHIPTFLEVQVFWMIPSPYQKILYETQAAMHACLTPKCQVAYGML